MQAYDATKDSALKEQVKQLKVKSANSPNDSMSLEEIKNTITKKITDINKASQGLNDAMPSYMETWRIERC